MMISNFQFPIANYLSFVELSANWQLAIGNRQFQF